MQFNNEFVTDDGSFSPGGRYTTPMPLWDGTNRAIVSYAIAPDANFGGIPTETHPFNGSVKQVFGPTKYQIWMLDFNQQLARVVQVDSPGKALVDPVALFPRALSDYPSILPNKPVDPVLASEPNGLGGQGMGVLGVRSVYHTDFLDIMGDRVLVPGLGESIPKNGGVPDLLAMKDPNNASYLSRPGYFARVTRALPTPPGISRSAIGRTNFEMQEVMGYINVEPDGSTLAKVAADSALTITVLDKAGRAFQTHTNWLQVRPGETRTCNGCHSPRRAESSINISPIAGSHANAIGAETMAETRARLNDEVAPSLSSSIDFTEFWSAGLETDFSLSLANIETPVPDNGRIDYVNHIQPLWDKDRGANTCTSCHNNSLLADPISAGLSLEGGLPGNGGHVISYTNLMIGPFKLDENGVPLPPVVSESGRVSFPRSRALVRVGSSRNSSRTSHLVETIYNSTLRAGGSYSLGVTDHSNMLSEDEKWLVSTWVDVGAQYTNEPYELVNGQYVVRDAIVSSRGVSRQVFNDQIHPILKAECFACHQPEGFSGDSTVDPEEFADENDEADEFNRFVLTGNQSGDFNVTRAMINNLCDPQNNDLLLRPISDNVAPNLPHAQILVDINDPLSATQPVFSDTGPGSSYDTILTWITMGAASNPTCL
jgi:cytochrome c553